MWCEAGRHLADGRKRWKSFKTFQFIKISEWLKHIFSSDDFIELIAHWRTKDESKNIEDIYDGRLWKYLESQGFFTDNNLALRLNIDWFKPFKHSEYKVAAIMVTVLNLPVDVRNKRKWTIIAGN